MCTWKTNLPMFEELICACLKSSFVCVWGLRAHLCVLVELIVCAWITHFVCLKNLNSIYFKISFIFNIYAILQEGHKWLKSVHRVNDKLKPAILAWETVSYLSSACSIVYILLSYTIVYVCKYLCVHLYLKDHAQGSCGTLWDMWDDSYWDWVYEFTTCMINTHHFLLFSNIHFHEINELSH